MPAKEEAVRERLYAVVMQAIDGGRSVDEIRADIDAVLAAVDMASRIAAKSAPRPQGTSPRRRQAPKGAGQRPQILDQVCGALEDLGRPATADEIYEALKGRRNAPKWKSPVNSMRSLYLRDKKEGRRLRRDSPGKYGLSEWGEESGSQARLIENDSD